MVDNAAARYRFDGERLMLAQRGGEVMCSTDCSRIALAEAREVMQRDRGKWPCLHESAAEHAPRMEHPV